MVKGTNGAPLAPVLRLAAVVDEVDSEASSKLYFAQQQRHVLEAFAFYAAYKRGVEWGDSGHLLPNLSLVPNESVPPALDSEPQRAAAQRLDV
jgi:hypothetical protein